MASFRRWGPHQSRWFSSSADAICQSYLYVGIAFQWILRAIQVYNKIKSNPKAEMGGEETEFHQRQPLLGDEGGTGGECRPSRFHNPASSFNQQGIFSPRRARNGSAIQIEIELPPVERSSSETKFPIERWKTFVALLFVLINFILTTTSLSITHELRRPQSKVGFT